MVFLTLNFKKKRLVFARFFLLPLHLVGFSTLAGLLLSGCSSRDSGSSQSNYFNFQHFFSQEAKDLSATKTQLKKVNLFDTLIDSVTISVPDWQKELALFSAIDLNKPAWKNSFTIDSILQDSLVLIRYTAKKKQLSIRKVEISFLHRKAIKFHIMKAADNFVYATTQELWFEKNTGFKISGRQKVLWFFEKQYVIKGFFYHG